jgi:hypothetical protein
MCVWLFVCVTFPRVQQQVAVSKCACVSLFVNGVVGGLVGVHTKCSKLCVRAGVVGWRCAAILHDVSRGTPLFFLAPYI